MFFLYFFLKFLLIVQIRRMEKLFQFPFLLLPHITSWSSHTHILFTILRCLQFKEDELLWVRITCKLWCLLKSKWKPHLKCLINHLKLVNFGQVSKFCKFWTTQSVIRNGSIWWYLVTIQKIDKSSFTKEVYNIKKSNVY